MRFSNLGFFIRLRRATCLDPFLLCIEDLLESVREYEERNNVVDAGSFTPMIASSTGGMGPDPMQMALYSI